MPHFTGVYTRYTRLCIDDLERPYTAVATARVGPNTANTGMLTSHGEKIANSKQNIRVFSPRNCGIKDATIGIRIPTKVARIRQNGPSL